MQIPSGLLREVSYDLLSKHFGGKRIKIYPKLSDNKKLLEILSKSEVNKLHDALLGDRVYIRKNYRPLKKAIILTSLSKDESFKDLSQRCNTISSSYYRRIKRDIYG